MNNNSKQDAIGIALIVLMIIALIISCLLTSCRTVKTTGYKYYESGAIQSIMYQEEHGFHFWSDAEGKTIEISPTLLEF